MAFRTNKMPVLQEKSASGSVASFNTALSMPLSSCNIAVNAWQEGSGEPSPVNNRPIHGFSEVNLTANNAIYIQLGQEVYGAEVDVVNGVAHCTHAQEIKSTSAFYSFDAHAGTPCSSAYIDVTNDIKVLDVYNTQSIIDAGFMSNKLKTLYSTYTNSGAINSIRPYSPNNRYRMYCFFDGSVITQASDISTIFGDSIQIRYPLAEPFDIQLTPTQIETLIGNNTIFADTGDIDLTYKDLDIAKRGNFREVFKLPS